VHQEVALGLQMSEKFKERKRFLGNPNSNPNPEEIFPSWEFLEINSINKKLCIIYYVYKILYYYLINYSLEHEIITERVTFGRN